MGVSVYLASPFFNKAEVEMKKKIKNKLIDCGITIIDPQTKFIENGWELPNHEWGKRTFEHDVQLINNADAVIAIDWGMYSDVGTAWEIGYAYGMCKPILVVVPDAVLNQKHSIMVANGSNNFITESRLLSIKSQNELIEYCKNAINPALGITVS